MLYYAYQREGTTRRDNGKGKKINGALIFAKDASLVIKYGLR